MAKKNKNSSAVTLENIQASVNKIIYTVPETRYYTITSSWPINNTSINVTISKTEPGIKLSYYFDQIMMCKHGTQLVRVVKDTITSEYRAIECVKNDDGNWHPGLFYTRQELIKYYRPLTTTEKLLYGY